MWVQNFCFHQLHLRNIFRGREDARAKYENMAVKAHYNIYNQIYLEASNHTHDILSLHSKYMHSCNLSAELSEVNQMK